MRLLVLPLILSLCSAAFAQQGAPAGVTSGVTVHRFDGDRLSVHGVGSS